MAKTIELPDDVLQTVAARIAPSLGLLFSRGENTEVELGESFEVWYLDGAINDPTLDLGTRVRFSERYHHQMLLDNVPAGFAISKPGRSPADWDVTRIAPSPFAQDVSQAIDEIDRLFPDDTPVRLLKVPAYLLSAFWLVHPVVEQQKFYVISCPAFFTFLRKGLVLSRDEFVKALAEEQATEALSEQKSSYSPPPPPPRPE
jgi:hypothetical protein